MNDQPERRFALTINALAEVNTLYSQCLNGNQVLRQRAQEAEEQGIKEAEAAYACMEKAETERDRFRLALLKYPEWLEDGDGMEFGSDECSFCEAMRQDGHADDCIWATAQAALNPDAREEGGEA